MSECCSCHISPPCNYCTDREECVTCGEVMLSEYLTNHICEDCRDEIEFRKQAEGTRE